MHSFCLVVFSLGMVSSHLLAWKCWLRDYERCPVSRSKHIFGNCDRCQGAKNDKVALIGYSGGAAHVTWVAKGYNGGPTNWSSSFGERPHIDLLVAYDPSPRGATFTLGDNVGKAIVYQNSSPMMFGLGGATISGPQVEVVEIAQHHLLVQTNTKLHDRTVEEVRKLTEAPNDSSIEGIQRK